MDNTNPNFLKILVDILDTVGHICIMRTYMVSNGKSIN